MIYRKLLRNPLKFGAVAATALMMPAAGALAQDMSDEGRTNAMSDMSDMKQNWAEMRRNAIHGSELLDGSYRAGLNPTLNIENIVLDDEGTAVEYVILDSDRTPWGFYNDNGYVTWESVDVEHGSAISEVDLNGGGDTDMANMSGPEEIAITASEADRRLLSRVIESDMRIGGGESFYEIHDVLIQPESGRISHYVIATQPGVLFSDDRRAVPANEVEWQNGMFTTDLDMQRIEGMQEYDPGLL